VELAGQRVVVVGLARSGIAAAEHLARRGAQVVAVDRKPAGQLPPEALSLQDKGVRLELGDHHPETFTSAALVVVSPGVPWDLPDLQAAREAGVPVIAELELGYRELQGRVAAVTGTKGKSTTTAVLGAMLRESGRDVRVGGNIGQAVTSLLEGASVESVFVLEVSSFQLEGTDAFHPEVALFLNLSPDHLDRHPSFQEYAEAKARIFRNQTSADWAVVNADDPAVMALAGRGQARVLPFRGEGTLEEGAFFSEGHALLRRDGREEALFPRDAVRVPGAHLAVDLLAAGAGARLMGATPAEITRAVESFRGVEHVLERVDEVGGVVFFNDSKATNVDAARRSLEAFPGPLLPILGGHYKGGDFAELGPALRDRAKLVLAIGEARERIATALRSTVPIVDCGSSLREAVERAYQAAVPGDTVLLAPACASFDMFTDYAERGRAFKDEVRRLKESLEGRS
jgi:UDP-N-acetylmuramoylalanine--D-glutamate ligase